MKTGIAAIAGALLAILFCAAEAFGRPSASGKCAAAEHRQFDFWAGEWDAYGLDEGNKLVARARVEVILDGCALLEVYDQLDGLKGQSFSVYDSSRQTWHQSWVTNRGKLLTLEGRFEDGRMTLTGSDRDANGRPVLIRGVWKRAEGGVRETAETSADGGKTWKAAFDILFKPRRSGVAASSEEERVVAAMDTQYQAAVAKNDAAVMGRILADDFILVTGKGKVYTKSDLLADARSGKTVYERQDDASQKVRVWGDTAVVTALLTAKGTRDGKPFSYRLWFSDTYVKTAAGWRYVFGQASSPLPETD